MRGAGLTHGGFYTHFHSKDDLLADAVSHAMADARTNLDRLGGKAPAGLLDVARAYLSAPHLNNPTGVVRSPPSARSSRAESNPSATPSRARSASGLGQLDDLLPPKTSPQTRKRQTAGALACMVGGLILARGLKPSERAGFLADCQAFLKEALTQPDEPA